MNTTPIHTVCSILNMRTTGERVRQAREYRGLTQDQLAQRVGYHNQSAIGNLENRATGRGGFKLPRIAQELGFPLEWFHDGPDYDNLADLERELRAAGRPVGVPTEHRQEHMAALLDQLNEEGAERAVEYVELLQYKYRRDSDERALESATLRHNTPARKAGRRA